MEIFSNWIFWVVLASIIFILALIGYLSESLQKPKKDEKKEDTDNAEQSTVEAVQPETLVKEEKNDDWMAMPEINKPLEEVTVDSIEENTDSANMDEPNNNGVFADPVNADVQPVDSADTNVSNDANADSTVSAESVPSTSESQSTSEATPINDEKNNDIWNL